MADIYISLDQLRDVKTNLNAIITEFDNASGRADDLEDAIGDPFGDNRLREKAEDFEDRWDKKRDQLKDSLQEVHDHVGGVITGVEDWDAATAIQLESKK